jgi:hypothetical protein
MVETGNALTGRIVNRLPGDMAAPLFSPNFSTVSETT